jgi:cytochrome c biogenesis protein CcdA
MPMLLPPVHLKKIKNNVMKSMFNIVLYSLILSIITTVLVWFNIKDEIEDHNRRTKVILRTFVISLGIMFVFCYFTNNDPTDEAISNMKKSPPDF